MCVCARASERPFLLLRVVGLSELRALVVAAVLLQGVLSGLRAWRVV